MTGQGVHSMQGHTEAYSTLTKGPALYAAQVKTRGGKRLIMMGTFNDCVAFIHELGNRVKKARIQALQ